MEKIVKTFYDALDEGKILGRKCTGCSAVEFPPVLTCNSCGELHDMEWVEISGKGKMVDFFLPGMMTHQPVNDDMKPYTYGSVEIEEGAYFNCIIKGVKKKNREYMEEHLPNVPVHAIIVPRDGYKMVAFEVDEDFLAQAK